MKKRYDSYKPSGIDWIGDIPSHWDILPLKRISTMFGRIGYRGYTVQDLRVEGEGAITLSPSNMSNGGMNYENVSYLSWEKFHESPEIKIQEGDILFVKTGSTFGKTSYVDELPMEATINPQILRIVPSIHKKYLAYCMGTPYSQALTDCYVVGSTIPTISQESIGKFVFCVPPLAEQEAIAAWLDEKCGEIDAAIAKVDREIELIDELKQSEISRVVTRGLNPDTPLRPSGIDWIGDIPKHWIICKVKHLVKFNSGDTITSEQFIDNAEFPVYGANGYRGQFDKYNFENQRILIGRVGALCGNVHYTNEKIWCSEHALISSKAFGGLSFDYKWMCLLFESMNLNQYGGGSAQPVIASSVIENLSIILPPLSEQQAIADYLDKKCTEIDGLKAKLSKKRETLTELRQSIISEVVTGKRKVI